MRNEQVPCERGLNLSFNGVYKKDADVFFVFYFMWTVMLWSLAQFTRTPLGLSGLLVSSGMGALSVGGVPLAWQAGFPAMCFSY